MNSASNRNRGPRVSSRLYVSRSSNRAVTAALCRYVAEVTINRTRAIMSHALARLFPQLGKLAFDAAWYGTTTLPEGLS